MIESGFSDPYINTSECVKRLYKQYTDHNNTLIVGFDFDDTVYNFKDYTQKFNTVRDLLKECKRRGYTLCLYTCESDENKLKKKTEMCSLWGFTPDYVNESPVQFEASSKPFFNILLDDHAGLGQAVTVLTETLKMIDERI